MISIRWISLAVITFLIGSPNALGAIITRFGDGTVPTLFVNTGTVNIPIFIRASSNEVGITAYLSQFSISPPSALGSAPLIGPLGSSTFGQPSFFGAGNITVGPASYFQRNSSTTAELSLELPNPQIAPPTFQTIALMQINTADLPIGTYNVTVTPLGVADQLGTVFTTSGINGQFIVAVPEPSSIALMIVSGAGTWLAARRRIRLMSRKNDLKLS